MRARAAIFALLMSGCSADSISIIADLPEGVGYVAALVEDADGRLLVSTGLLKYVEGSSSEIEVPGDATQASTAWVIGYAGTEFAKPPSDEILEARPVRRAEITDALLPVPAWSGTAIVEDGVASVSSSTNAPELTASWLPACPIFVPEGADVLSDISCSIERCPTDAVQIVCSLRLEFGGCALQSLDATVDGRGALHAEASTNFVDCRWSPAVADATLSLECSDCDLDLYTPPFDPPFVSESIPVLDVEYREAMPFPPYLGYLGGMVVLDDRVVVSHFDGEFAGWLCESPQPTTLATYSMDLVLTGSRAQRPCLTRLIQDPGRDGFLGVFGHFPSFVGRFNREGILISSSTITIPNPTTQFHPTAMTVTSNGRIIVGVSQNTNGGNGHLVSFDLETLAQLGTASLGEHFINSIVEVNNWQVAVGVEPDSLVHFVSSDTLIFTDFTRVSPVSGLQKGTHHLSFDPSTGQLLVASGGGQGATFALSGVDPLGYATFYERLASPVSTRPTTSPHDVVSTLMTLDGLRTTLVARIDLDPLRYRPGVVEIGNGPALEVQEDPAGRFWAMLPWSGHLVRLTPAP